MVVIVRVVDEGLQVQEFLGQAGFVVINGLEFCIYGSLGDANRYHAANLAASAWFAATGNQREQALVSAARWLDRQTWQGSPTTPGQCLAWPRTGVIDCDGQDVPDDVVPQEIVTAEFELALVLLQDPTVPSQPTLHGASNVQSVQAGSVSVTFFSPVHGGKLPVIANDLVKCFLEGFGSGGIGQALATGTGAESSFDDDDAPDLSGPLP